MKVRSKHGEPERGRSTIEDEMCGLGEIAARLAKSASNRGFSVGFVIVGYDPILQESWQTRGYSGDMYSVAGAMHSALRKWEKECED